MFELFGRLCILAGMQWCAPDPNIVASSLIFERCLNRIESGQSLNYEGLETLKPSTLPTENPLWTGRRWIEGSYGFKLLEPKNGQADPVLLGCRADLEPSPTGILEGFSVALIRDFERWITESEESQSYRLADYCGPKPEYFIRVFESIQPNPRGNYLRGFLLVNDELSLRTFVVTEVGPKPMECNSETGRVQ